MTNSQIYGHSYPIEVQLASHSRLPESDIKSAPFGTVFGDHMFVAEYQDGKWGKARIVPFNNLPLSPSLAGLNYGQSIFEGMKAYRDVAGGIQLFRPKDHHARLNRSAVRTCMPEIPEDLFINGLETLLDIDRDWVPTGRGTSLYIRPIYFATDTTIGMHPSHNYVLVIFTSPSIAYYNRPVQVLVQTSYVRAYEGGVGYVKLAGNYAHAMLASKQARDAGYDVVLWLDAKNRRFIEEFGTMNAFFVLDDMVVTPRLTGTILEGITRDSVLRVLTDAGIRYQERDISIDEIREARASGLLKEAFGTGTAASVAPVAAIHGDGFTIEMPPYAEWKVAPMLAERLTDIRTAAVPDPYGWLHKVDSKQLKINPVLQ